MEFRINYTRTTFNLELIVSVHQKLKKYVRIILYVAQGTSRENLTRGKNGENAFLLRVASVAKRKCDL